MRDQTPIHERKAEMQTLATVQTGLLQRTCACGGAPGVDGDCGECRENQLSLQRNTSDQQNTPLSASITSLAGHNLSRLPVHSNNPAVLQTKLVVNEPGDKYEQEADQVAERVMGSLESGYTQTTNLSGNTYSNSIQHKHPQGEELNRQPEQEEGEREEDETLQAKTVSSEKPIITPEIQTHINSIKGNGQALPKSYQYHMKTHFGHDFSKVKIHTDTNAAETARALHARAYTINQDIVFGAGQYAPETYEGKKLLAHELTHVVQQMPNAATPQRVYRQSETQPSQQQSDIEKRLIEETIRIAKSPITFLRGAYIRKSLEERKSRKHLLEVFNSAVQHVLTQRESDNRKLIQLIGIEAQKLLQTVELEFIHDPQASTLDLLPGDKGQKYRNFLWGKNDFPGNEPLKGEQEDEQTKQLRLEHQKEARKMAGALSEVRPERRVNTGKAAVMTKSEFHWEYVDQQMETVPGQGNHRLNRYAKDSFIKMHADALQDGVDLVILSSDRTPSKAKRNAARAGNPTAVAKFSAHTLGLAVDLQMSQGKQEFKEITTRPMSNVVGMHQSPVHKWLFLRGAAYGWYPYQNEPWHWEYNPPGFREKFQEDMQKEAAKSSSTSETPVLQRSANGSLPSQSVPQTMHEVLRSPGEPLNASIRAFMESRFGHDFSNVRVHTDARAAESARDVNAHAYTAGPDIVFGHGQYAPGTSRGNKLLAHELTHTVQQTGQHNKQSTLQRGISSSVIQRKDDPKSSAPIFPTRLNTSEVETPPYPSDSEERLDLLIKKRQEENLPSSTGKRLGKVNYTNLPAKKEEQGTDANIERRAVKSAILYKITSSPEEWADREFRLRVPMEDGPVAYTYAMVILRFDKDRNVEATYAGPNVQAKGSVSEPSLTMKRLASEYQVTFVINAISVQMPGDAAPTQFTTKNWSANDTTLLGQALPMLGAAERAIINGKKFRRLNRKNHKDTAGFFNTQDDSINLMDDALPFDKDIWFGEGGKFYTRGIHTVLHEIGHALHYSTVPATGTAPPQVMLEAFKTAVRSESQRRTGSLPGPQQFPPPGIDLPTDYSKKSWKEFFADSYSIYKTNPAFLNTPKHKYLYDFFKNRFP
jgi:hypothetical protein